MIAFQIISIALIAHHIQLIEEAFDTIEWNDTLESLGFNPEIYR